VNAPYSQAEITELVSWSRGLSTATMRRNVRALLSIGLGAGLSAREISRLAGTDVREEQGFVVVDVVGERARTVPVRHVWAGEVLELARESGDRPFFRPERTRIVRNDILTFIDRCTDKGQDAKFCIQRLRVTWMVGHLAAGVPVGVLAQAAGVAATHLVKYVRFVPVPDADEARKLLAGIP
jgi:site-specific recombinase XerC